MVDATTAQVFARFGLALVIGLLIGIQREYSFSDDADGTGWGEGAGMLVFEERERALRGLRDLPRRDFLKASAAATALLSPPRPGGRGGAYAR